LPLADPATAPPPVADAPPAGRASQGWGLSGAAVVVIDDDDGVREATADLIGRWQCVAIQARGGRDAAAVAGRLDRRPDLLLVDY
ncbi:hypothetical protein J8J27_31510, partial [Mycobacterium tuberculosis]|nr:hypothetical protein [Mycobacterium tuberculosis]